MTNDFNTLQFYYPYLFFMIIIYLLIVLIVKLMKNRYNKPWFIQADFYAKREGIQIEHDLLTPKQKSLRTRYLIASFLVRSSMWIQAAYVFALYNRRHGFTIGEIGVLYGIDALSALMMGPILGSLSDLYGRKKFCLLYCLLVIAYVSLRLTENKSLAYVSQILSGISLSIFHISFESWLNFETGIIFSPDKESRLEKNTYLREIFSMQVMIDCFTSVILSSLGSYLYSKFGIEFPFYVAILFVFLGGVFIFLEWNENDRTLYRMNNAGFIEFEESEHHSVVEKIKYSWHTITSDANLLSVGLIEICFLTALQLFVFFWTPMLEEVAGRRIHPGAVFLCFMMARLIGAEFFQLFKITLQSNSYLISVVISITAMFSFLFDFIATTFNTRLFMFVYFDGLCGIFIPLFSSLKSEMIPENLRTTIMSFFRIPVFFFTVIFLFVTKYVSIYGLCLICLVIMGVGSLVNFYLLCIHEPPDRYLLELSSSLKHLKHHKEHNILNKEN